LNLQQGKQDRDKLTAFRFTIKSDVMSKRMPLGCVGDYCVSDDEVTAIIDWADHGGLFTDSQVEQEPVAVSR